MKFKNPFKEAKEARAQSETALRLLEEESLSRDEAERNYNKSSAELSLARQEIAGLDKELSDIHELVTILHDRYEKDVRIGSVRISTADIQARCRQIVGNVKIEGPFEPQLWVIKADTELPEADLNAIRAQFQSALEIDRS